MNPILCLPLALCGLQLSAPDDPFTRFELEGGVEVQVLHMPDAPRQSTFTLLDFGLLDDGPGRAQWAHLIEHVLIREDTSAAAGHELGVNGETRGGTLRLESLAPPDRWRESLAMHVGWLSFEAIDGEVLTREIAAVLSEVDNTQTAGFTHKWALAGAAQVLLHGQQHARVRGDIRDATPAAVAEYVAEVVPLDRVRLCTVGPATPDQVRAALEPLLAERALTPRAPRPTLDPPAPGDRAATWDLSVPHYLEVYPLDLNGSEDRLAAEVLAQLVTLRVHDSEQPGLAHAAVEEFGALGPCLVISYGLAQPYQAARARCEAAIAPLRAGEGMQLARQAAFGLRRQFTVLPDLADLRKRLAGRPGVDFIEGQLALNMTSFELRMGYPLATLGPALEALDTKRVARIAQALTARGRRSVYLSPQ